CHRVRHSNAVPTSFLHNATTSSINNSLSLHDALPIYKNIAQNLIEEKTPVICEKPLSDNYEDAKKLATFAHEANVPNYMGMQYRYHDYAQIIKEVIDSGKLGDIIFYRHNLGGSRLGNYNIELEWRMKQETSGHGAITDFGIHQLDLMDFFLKNVAGDIKEMTA